MGRLYRIIRDKYRHEPLSVVGSRLVGGRWNPKGTGVLYATSTAELGLVETLARAPGVRYEDLPTGCFRWTFLMTSATLAGINYLITGKTKPMIEPKPG